MQIRFFFKVKMFTYHDVHPENKEENQDQKCYEWLNEQTRYCFQTLGGFTKQISQKVHLVSHKEYRS